MATFYAKSTIFHNGNEFSRGDAIELPENTDLLGAGVVQAEPITEEAPVARDPRVHIEEARKAEQSVVGGNEVKTGEPSIDGQASADNETDAREVGPNAPATPAGTDEGTGGTGFFGKMFGGNSDQQGLPANDPSKDL